MSRRSFRKSSKAAKRSASAVVLAAIAVIAFWQYILILVSVALFGVLTAVAIKYLLYKESTYYKITKQPYFALHRNVGLYGEYLTYKKLQSLEKKGAKFLFNVYVPKENGETSEIDVLMICEKGLFVFESKNYSGWIFGTEDQLHWYQTLKKGWGKSQKEQFYNPIMQNNSHIKHLTAFLGKALPM